MPQGFPGEQICGAVFIAEITEERKQKEQENKKRKSGLGRGARRRSGGGVSERDLEL